MHTLVKTNSVVKHISVNNTEVNNYIKEAGLVQIVPSTDTFGETALVFTETGLIETYIEDNKIFCVHKLETGDYYVTEYSLNGIQIGSKLNKISLPVYL